MTVILKIDTNEKLYEPIEIEIDNERFTVTELTVDLLEEVQKKALSGSIADVKKNVKMILRTESPLIGKLTIQQFRKLIESIVEAGLNPPAELKNEPKPGDAMPQ